MHYSNIALQCSLTHSQRYLHPAPPDLLQHGRRRNSRNCHSPVAFLTRAHMDHEWWSARWTRWPQWSGSVSRTLAPAQKSHRTQSATVCGICCAIWSIRLDDSVSSVLGPQCWREEAWKEKDRTFDWSLIESSDAK